jgi:ketopantoate hydroxymethyltransferase
MMPSPNAAALMRVGAHAVKLEGTAWLADTVTQLARGGIPCCVHMGLTPQSVTRLWRLQSTRQNTRCRRTINCRCQSSRAGRRGFIIVRVCAE